MTRQPAKSAGSWEQRKSRAFGPPVDTPMATMRVGRFSVGCGFGTAEAWGVGWNVSLGGPEIAATLILTASSLAICSNPPFEASVGLATKSKAPWLSAFNAEYAPLEV